MLGAAFALLTVSLAGSGALEGSRLVRMGRSAQRLEAADGIPHSHEQDEPDPAPSGLVVAQAIQSTVTDNAALRFLHAAPPDRTSSGRAPLRLFTSQAVQPGHAPALAGAPPGVAAWLTLQDVFPRSTRSIRPALGRAPPAA
jgi:hypothetical protein